MISIRELQEMFAEHEQHEAERATQQAKADADLQRRRVAALKAEQMTAQDEADQALADLAAEFPEEV
jgi:hypothetical protein